MHVLFSPSLQINETTPGQSFKCQAEGCTKTCKTKGGLRRHVIVKHPKIIEDEIKQKEQEETERARNLMHPGDIKKLVKEVAITIYENKCLPQSYRDVFQGYTITPEESKVIFDAIKKTILKYKEGNEHVFIVDFREISEKTEILPRLKGIFNGKPYWSLVRELSFKCLSHLRGQASQKTSNIGSRKLTEREIAALQYLSGHVIRKTYYKLRKSPSWRKPSHQQCIDLLSKVKILPTEEHKLIKARDRGGLWYVSKDVVDIFETAEIEFNNATQTHVRRINYKAMLPIIMKNINVKHAYRKIIENSQVTIEKDLSKDLLEKLISLYLRIRCHSFAKDVREKHKMIAKINRAKSLRHELERKEKVKCQEM